MSPAPIVFFAYNRPMHTQRTLESLKKNKLAAESKLYVFMDGPKSDAGQEELKKVDEVREIVKSDQWCKDIECHYSDVNRGFPNFLPKVLTEMFEKYDRLIILEDDLELSPVFLDYMNNALELYKDEERVMHISGYMSPSRKKLPDHFFVQVINSWGWATWKRAWDKFEHDGKKLYRKVLDKNLYHFDVDGSFDFMNLLKRCNDGVKNHWDARWYASFYLENGLALTPGKTYVRNIGYDGSGQHCNTNYLTPVFNTQKLNTNPAIGNVPLKESKKGRKALIAFNDRLLRPSFSIKVAEKFKSVLGLKKQ